METYIWKHHLGKTFIVNANDIEQARGYLFLAAMEKLNADNFDYFIEFIKNSEPIVLSRYRCQIF